MWNDVVDLREFYESRTGQVARHMIRQRLRGFWPDVSGEVVLGLGFATPYLRQFKNKAERVISLMPAAQGVVHWPPEGPNAVGLVDETELPLPDYSVDKVLLVHCVENGDYLRDMMQEVWRVMKGEARLLVVVPNRRGLWARKERTPFGCGYPFSPSQISRLLRENNFTPLRNGRALYVPPTKSGWVLRSAAAWERMGRRFAPHFAGVNVIEASKQVYAGTAIRVDQRRRRGVVVRLPKPQPALGQVLPRALTCKPLMVKEATPEE
ncbi:class I SAM-dependent methyltransferase [Rhodovibrionaceae bacterium A322]